MKFTRKLMGAVSRELRRVEGTRMKFEIARRSWRNDDGSDGGGFNLLLEGDDTDLDEMYPPHELAGAEVETVDGVIEMDVYCYFHGTHRYDGGLSHNTTVVIGLGGEVHVGDRTAPQAVAELQAKYRARRYDRTHNVEGHRENFDAATGRFTTYTATCDGIACDATTPRQMAMIDAFISGEVEPAIFADFVREEMIS